MCWAACRRLARIAGVLDLPDRAAYWRAHADRIRHAILGKAWNADLNSFVERFDGVGLDASVLLLQEIGLAPEDNLRFPGNRNTKRMHMPRGNRKTIA